MRPYSKRLKTAKNRLWKFVSEYIRKRDCLKTTGTEEYGLCYTCGKRIEFKEAHAGHFIPQGSCSELRYDERNIRLQCAGCNTYGYGQQGLFLKHMQEEGLHDVANELLKRYQSHNTKKWNLSEIEELEEYYKEKIRNL